MVKLMNEIVDRLASVIRGRRQIGETTVNDVSPMVMATEVQVMTELAITDYGDQVNKLNDENLNDCRLRECRVFRLFGRPVGLDGSHITWDATTKIPIGTCVKRNDGRIYEVVGLKKTRRTRFESVMTSASEIPLVRVVNNA